jgi:hypothetical protein
MRSMPVSNSEHHTVPTAGKALFAAMSEGSKVRGSLAQYEPQKKELRMQIDFPYAIQ